MIGRIFGSILMLVSFIFSLYNCYLSDNGAILYSSVIINNILVILLYIAGVVIYLDYREREEVIFNYETIKGETTISCR